MDIFLRGLVVGLLIVILTRGFKAHKTGKRNTTIDILMWMTVVVINIQLKNTLGIAISLLSIVLITMTEIIENKERE